MRMLRWMAGIKRIEKMITKTLKKANGGVANISDNIRGTRLNLRQRCSIVIIILICH